MTCRKGAALAPLLLAAILAPRAAWADLGSNEPMTGETGSSTIAEPTVSSTTARAVSAREARADMLLAMAQSGLIEPLWRRLTMWDLNLEGGFGRRLDADGTFGGLFRARAGVLFVREPMFYALGATFVAQNQFAPAFGLQAEATSTETGLWGQLEGLLDLDGRVGGTVAVGLTVFGLEVQARDTALGVQGILLAKVRLPVSILVFSLTQ